MATSKSKPGGRDTSQPPASSTEVYNPRSPGHHHDADSVGEADSYAHRDSRTISSNAVRAHDLPGGKIVYGDNFETHIRNIYNATTHTYEDRQPTYSSHPRRSANQFPEDNIDRYRSNKRSSYEYEDLDRRDDDCQTNLDYGDSSSKQKSMMDKDFAGIQGASGPASGGRSLRDYRDLADFEGENVKDATANRSANRGRQFSRNLSVIPDKLGRLLPVSDVLPKRWARRMSYKINNIEIGNVFTSPYSQFCADENKELDDPTTVLTPLGLESQKVNYFVCDNVYDRSITGKLMGGRGGQGWVGISLRRAQDCIPLKKASTRERDTDSPFNAISVSDDTDIPDLPQGRQGFIDLSHTATFWNHDQLEKVGELIEDDVGYFLGSKTFVERRAVNKQMAKFRTKGADTFLADGIDKHHLRAQADRRTTARVSKAEDEQGVYSNVSRKRKNINEEANEKTSRLKRQKKEGPQPTNNREDFEDLHQKELTKEQLRLEKASKLSNDHVGKADTELQQGEEKLEAPNPVRRKG